MSWYKDAWSIAESDLNAADVLRLLDGARAVAVARCDECKKFGFAWWDGKDKVTHAMIGLDDPLVLDEHDAGYIAELEDHEDVVESLRNTLHIQDICPKGHGDALPSSGSSVNR